MENIECPHCSKQTITPGLKFRAGKWSTISCPDCNGRMCSNPTVLALIYFILTWVILFFGYLAIRESSMSYAIMMIAGWVIVEFFIFYVPLSRMRSLQPASQKPENRNHQDKDHQDKDASDG